MKLITCSSDDCAVVGIGQKIDKGYFADDNKANHT